MRDGYITTTLCIYSQAYVHTVSYTGKHIFERVVPSSYINECGTCCIKTL